MRRRSRERSGLPAIPGTRQETARLVDHNTGREARDGLHLWLQQLRRQVKGIMEEDNVFSFIKYPFFLGFRRGETVPCY